jgi:NCAIR mutase (PurE)-related protein
MDTAKLNSLLEAVASGDISAATALDQIKKLPYADLDFAKVDTHRALRQGIPEVIFCPGKTPEQIVAIAKKLHEQNHVVVATRADQFMADQVVPHLKGAIYHAMAKMIVLPGSTDATSASKSHTSTAIITAGTADLPVAEEAAAFLTASGYPIQRINDVGVAGLHRLLSNLDSLLSADVIIVVAGMDGALPSVVGGLVAVPVIAVPTSVGYGSSFDGLAALLSMLNSCAAGLTVVNIDNGFGAAVAAIRILMMQAGRHV